MTKSDFENKLIEVKKTLQEDEVWKQIPNYENDYLISSKGKVKSLKRNKNLAFLFTGLTRNFTAVKLTKNGKYKQVSVAKLVLSTFLGIPLDELPLLVYFIDGDHRDAGLDNLTFFKDKIRK